MRNNKLIKRVISNGVVIAVTFGIIPASIALADVVENSNDVSLITADITTGSAVTLNNSNSNILENSSIQEDVINTENVDFVSQYENAEKALRDYKATNSTSGDDILDAVKGNLNSSIDVSIEKFKKTDATLESEGDITGALLIKSNDESKYININLTIERLDNQQVLDTTTGASIEVTTGAAVTEVVSLKTEIDGNVDVGETVEAKVTGYDSEGNEVALNENNLSYKWFAGDKEVGELKNLTITENMDGKGVNCKVSYDDELKGGNN